MVFVLHDKNSIYTQGICASLRTNYLFSEIYKDRENSMQLTLNAMIINSNECVRAVGFFVIRLNFTF